MIARIFEKLKELIRIDININNKIKVIITKDSGNIANNMDKVAKEYHYDEDKKELTLNYDRVDAEAKKCLEELAKAQFERGGIYDNETQRELNSLYNYKKSSDDDNRILAFFKPIIPKDDCQALEVSLYLKKNLVNVSLVKLKR